jgi:hypothetical protein
MELAELKSLWTEVLDRLERTDRVAWLAFFDARLAQLDNGVLTLDFSDASKFPGGHDIKSTMPANRILALETAIKETTGTQISCRLT